MTLMLDGGAAVDAHAQLWRPQPRGLTYGREVATWRVLLDLVDAGR